MAFDFTRYNAFGWVVHCKRLAEGEKFQVHIPEAYDVKDAGNISLWTKGLVYGVNVVTGAVLPDRVPGSSVLAKTKVEAGEFLFTARVESEFWCINSVINRNRLPEVEVFDLAPGQAVEGQYRILLCSGTLMTPRGSAIGPAAIEVTDGAQAVDRVLGFRFP